MTAVIAGVRGDAALRPGPLEGLIVGAGVAATDTAAIFAVLRGSTLRKRLARSLEGESGMNDPIAVLLVTGFIAWIQEPGYGIADMGVEFVIEISVGAAIGLARRLRLARLAFRELDYPTARPLPRRLDGHGRRSPSGSPTSRTAPASSPST